MSEGNFKQFLPKKAYEVGYALFRIASRVKSKGFAERLEFQGLALLESAIREDCESVSITTKTIDYLLRFGADVGLINSENAKLVLEELNVINSAIAELINVAEPTAVKLDDIFSGAPERADNADAFLQERNDSAISNVHINNGNERKEVSTTNGSGRNGNGNGVVKSAMRQAAILGRIRQNGNCRLREIQEILPDASERTLRYDVQGLIEKGLVERVGNGGPATSYKAMELSGNE